VDAILERPSSFRYQSSSSAAEVTRGSRADQPPPSQALLTRNLKITSLKEPHGTQSQALHEQSRDDK
jgi:hypothetical protein